MENFESQNNFIQPNESLSKIKVSCPNCLKLFAVSPNEIQETRPRFQCNSCHQKFWIAYPESLEQPNGVIGFPLDWVEDANNEYIPQEQEELISPNVTSEPSFECIKCGGLNPTKAKECASCGVVFEKIIENKSVYASQELQTSWEKVIEDYENESTHDDFLRLAGVENNYAYAASKYQGIFEACPSDELASGMIQKIEAIVSAPVEVAAAEVKAAMPTKKSFLQRIRIGSLLILMCTIVIAMGYFVPSLRNLMGIGTAVLFILLALRFYFRLL